MTNQEITADLEKIQKTLEKMNGEDIDFIFLANNHNRGAFNGSPDGICALLMWNMGRYPLIRQIVLKAVSCYLEHEQEINKEVETDNPIHEIVEIKEIK